MKKMLLVFAVMFAFVAFPAYADNAEFNSEYTSIENHDLVAMNVGAVPATDYLVDDGGGGFAVGSTLPAINVAEKDTDNLVDSFYRSTPLTVSAVTASTFA